MIVFENGEGTTKDTVQLPVHHSNRLQEEDPLPLIFPSQIYDIQRTGVNVKERKKEQVLLFASLCIFRFIIRLHI